ncbi:similar to Saccharomyces cerevisiae YGL224C SDT1 Pyrimidine nucleotidase [Maudiozyma barnettii]|uniref:Similar to Saccharomyces cerevisiae YGL224C SDT1 Pyrimidine nucleotidase n=1 Tax=Maudiozyma barnettii TaxID=61262 RepID=A0A8H2VJ39_9SACH|nr:uncharacterized protein KABA2_08S05830 [Kazachstania barnettii]CAB4256214.1 similar to Saccharomyces cerevisiae YGL224C SDT1 Pyrimidine nucleotidase [Kazachstania barnettii]CAD1784822.1 similar to Saccharomyces cerevisiae YGL224C SDT1 Pyrimidine nucleotidase [Kazachstania barnettii]
MSEFERRINYRTQIEQQLLKNKLQLDSLDYEGSQLKPGFRTSLDDTPVEVDPDSKIFYFDIDNTLYRRSTGIQEMMQDAIYHYVRNELSIPSGTAKHIMNTYYKQYGLMAAGLVHNFNIDPLKYNMMVDDSLEIGHVLKPDLKLRKVLLQLKEDNQIEKLWLCTNAYVNHAVRCIRLLGIADLFDGITFTQYESSSREIICKPDHRFFERVKRESGLGNWNNAFFIDDSFANIQSAAALGMSKCFLVTETTTDDGNKLKAIQSIDDPDDKELEKGLLNNIIVVNSVLDLPKAEPQLFI